MLRFIRRLLGRERVSDVAARFTDQLLLLKMILYRWFEAEFGKLPEMEVPPGVIAGQVVNYLTGEKLDAVSESITEDIRASIEALRPDVPEIADNLMRQDRRLRQVIVQTLRMRLILNLHYRPTEAAASGLERRITDLLMTYGSEFPEEPSPRRYYMLLDDLVEWSESQEFPGREA